MSEGPIPPPRDDDDEDVHWALSTAGALWARGERAESVRWLRRAVEQASDAGAELRSLELAKAAADATSRLAAAGPSAGPGAAASTPPAPSARPTPDFARPSQTPAPPRTSQPPGRPSAVPARPPPPPPSRRGAPASPQERVSAPPAAPPAPERVSASAPKAANPGARGAGPRGRGFEDDDETRVFAARPAPKPVLALQPEPTLDEPDAPGPGAMEPEMPTAVDGPADDGVWSDKTDAQIGGFAAAPSSELRAFLVAVLPAGREGELRLLPAHAAPPAAVTAVLAPTTPEAADAIARMLAAAPR